MEYGLKALFTLAAVVVVLLLGRWIFWLWSTPLDPSATVWSLLRGLNPLEGKVVALDPAEIRQEGRVVGRVVGEVTEELGTVLFEYIVEARDLNRLEPFYYQGEAYEQLSVELVATTLVTSLGTFDDGLKGVRCKIVE